MRVSPEPARNPRRVEFGDWQTPASLAREVVEVVAARLPAPRSIVEPTCGEGAFLAAASHFPGATRLGFEVSPVHVATARERLGAQARVELGNFFELDWPAILESLPDPLLLLGNPPWVTNSTLGTIAAANLPIKSNSRPGALGGLDALTGKSNFDISEWIVIRLLELVHSRDFTLAMLCKASVARRVMEQVAVRKWAIAGEVRTIDARTHFAAAVDAVLLHVFRGQPSDAAAPRWAVYPTLEATTPTHHMGVVAGEVFSDLEARSSTCSLAGASTIAWRSGIKHDCAKVMELTPTNAGFTNGLGETLQLEREFVFPLLKGSDLANDRLVPRRRVIVPQRKLGEDTRAIRTRAPLTWRYLEAQRARLDARKSSIYRNQPAFAIFGIGDYAFAPYKVAICGLYKRLKFAVLRPFEGQPIMVDDTAYFLPCTSEDEAETLAAALASPRAQAFFEARVFWAAKRPINKALLESLSLEALLREAGELGEVGEDEAR